MEERRDPEAGTRTYRIKYVGIKDHDEQTVTLNIPSPTTLIEKRRQQGESKVLEAPGQSSSKDVKNDKIIIFAKGGKGGKGGDAGHGGKGQDGGAGGPGMDAQMTQVHPRIG